MIKKRQLIYDATLFVNAYETNLFRTGLYRVAERLLDQLWRSGQYDIWLYDTLGRERIMRQYILPQYADVNLLEQDASIYRVLTDKPLYWSDRLRKKQKTARSTISQKLYKVLKNLLVWYAKSVRYCTTRKTIQPSQNARYVATYFPIPRWVHDKHIPATLIVHDLIPLIHPEWFPAEVNKQMLHSIINSAMVQRDRVVCVSESTRRDFLSFRPDFPADHVSVAHLAAASVFVPTSLSDDLRQRLSIRDDYFLSVCTIEPRKNLQTVLDAYELLLQQSKSHLPQLVLTGAMGWKIEGLLQHIRTLQSRYPNQIVVTGYISDTDLAQLYTGASVFVYPTLYEGFGLPPLEAMQCGCPVVCSNVSSLPEVVGDAGEMVEPTNVNALAEALMRTFRGDSVTQRQKALDRAKEFSWERMAQRVVQTFDRYQSME